MSVLKVIYLVPLLLFEQKFPKTAIVLTSDGGGSGGGGSSPAPEHLSTDHSTHWFEKIILFRNDINPWGGDDYFLLLLDK